MPSHTLPAPRIALVYDRVNTSFGGAENVLTALHQIFPDAPLFTAVYDPQKAQWANPFRVFTSFVQHFPAAQQYHRQYVGLMPLAFESFNFENYDIIISITSAEAKGVLTKPDQLHICYLLTPSRYLWSHPEDYRQSWLVEMIKSPTFRYLRWWDTAAAQRPDIIIPISKRVAERCQNYYHRATEPVIYPPIDLAGEVNISESLPQELLQNSFKAGEYYLVVSRLVPYKRIDLVLKACAMLHRSVVIVGDGPEFSHLSRLAQSLRCQAKIQFIRAVQSTELGAYYKNCRAFLAPGEEDFGIAALEAHLFGKPAVIHARSGAVEISPDGISSTHLHTPSVSALAEAISLTDQRHWNKQTIQQQVAHYQTHLFQKQFRDQVSQAWRKFYLQQEIQ